VVGVAYTNSVLEEAGLPQELPVAVNVSMAVPLYVPGGVQVAFNVVLFGLNVPPTPPSSHIPPVAEPPINPPNAADVPPWQIAASEEPALAVGVAYTNSVVKDVGLPHELPVAVNVSVAVPLYVPGGVQVAFNVVLFGLNVPPTPPSVQVPPVAVPPIEPFKAPDVPPWQIAAGAEPALTIGKEVTLIVTVAQVVFVLHGEGSSYLP